MANVVVSESGPFLLALDHVTALVAVGILRRVKSSFLAASFCLKKLHKYGDFIFLSYSVI